jgi:hypothetical protein
MNIGNVHLFQTLFNIIPLTLCLNNTTKGAKCFKAFKYNMKVLGIAKREQ